MSDLKKKVLLIDDESSIRKLLRISFESEQMEVIEATTGQEGLSMSASYRPDLIVLDMGLPDIRGTIILQRIREWSQVPILILSVENDQEDIVAALDMGADDYLTKPFHTGELLARTRVLLRRSLKQNFEQATYKFKNICVDLEKKYVDKNGEQIKLTSTEYDLLIFLLKNAGKVVTPQQILKGVWGPTAPSDSTYPRVYIRHLRQKLESDSSRPELILNEPGVGYRFVLDEK